MRTQLLLILPLLAGTALTQEKPKATKPKSGILIFSMIRTIDETDEGRDIIAKLKEEMATKKQRLTDEAAKLQEKVKMLRDTKPADHTQDYWKDYEQAMATQARLEIEKQLFLQKKQDEMSRAMQQLLIGAQQAARDVMKERGAEIVLLTKTGPVGELATDQDAQQELLYRRVLCSDESLDITDEVIARMNKWYKEHKSTLGLPTREGEDAAEGGNQDPPKETPPKGAEKAKEKASKQ